DAFAAIDDRMRSVAYAIREVRDHAAEVVGVRNVDPFDRSTALQQDRSAGTERVRVLQFERSARAEYVEHVGGIGAKANVKICKASAFELERRADSGIDLGEARVVAVGARHGVDLDRFAREHVARGVETINAQILQRSAPMFLPQAMVFCRNLETKAAPEVSR